MQLIVSTFRWRETVRSKGAFYESLAGQMEAIHQSHPDLKADALAASARLLNRLFDEMHRVKLTRQQHLMFRLATLATLVETGAALPKKVAGTGVFAREGTDAAERDPAQAAFLTLCSRVNAALCAREAHAIAAEVLFGSGQWSPAEGRAIFESTGFDLATSQDEALADMDQLRAQL
jgi:hypothetical protein